MGTPHSFFTPDAVTTPSAWPLGPLLGFDTETTGVDPSDDCLITTAFVWRTVLRVDGIRPQSVAAWLADPGVEIPEATAMVYGVTTKRIRAKGRSATEVLAEVSGCLVVAVAADTPVVVFNASYDLALMEAGLARHGLFTMYSHFGHELGPIVDLLVLDRAIDRYRRGKRRLGGLYEAYGMCVDKALHTAEVDVTATLDVLETLTAAHPQLSELDPDEPMAFQTRVHRIWAESFNEWLARRSPSHTPTQTAQPLPDSPMH